MKEEVLEEGSSIVQVSQLRSSELDSTQSLQGISPPQSEKVNSSTEAVAGEGREPTQSGKPTREKKP